MSREHGRRGPRWLKVAVSSASAVGLGIALVWVAAPGNSWYLPGQSIEVRTGVEERINGRTVSVGVSPTGETASVDVAGNESTNLRVGDEVPLAWGVHLVIVSIDRQAPGHAEETGGVASVRLRLQFG